MKIRKSEQIRGRQRRVWKAAAVFGAAVLLAWCNPMVSLAEATGTVLPNSVNIRKQPDQESDVIGSSTVGKEISIRGKVDVSGITWYQVYVDANTMGYVRADMIEKKGDGDIPTVTVAAESQPAQAPEGGDTDSQESPAEGGAGSGAQVEAQESMDRQYASTKVQAKVRPDPSTSNNPVDSLTPGTQVVVSGKSEGSDSKTWYYVNFTGANGSEKTGYIRSDLLELGEMLPVEETPEEEPPEEPEEPAPTPRNDYELKIETTSDGEEVWYIYDNVTGQKQKLVPLLESSYSQSLGDDEADTKSIVKQRIVIVVLAVLLAILAVVTVIMAFKLRDAYYEDYEDDEDDETPEERPSARRAAERERETGRRAASERAREPGRRASAEEERRPRRREEAADGQDRRRREREVTYREEPDAEEAVRPARARKAKNFLLDDDEFEFEFLNMDDKDLK
ncbi:MAG: SH3 domain-containing protein [Lachnospiraceae bacterium]|nr:SH3 domain-containing protein [Lachnospiraceae bacterium]